MSETHIKLCVTEPYFLGKKKKIHPKNGGKCQKECFLKLLKNLVLDFFDIQK